MAKFDQLYNNIHRISDFFDDQECQYYIDYMDQIEAPHNRKLSRYQEFVDRPDLTEPLWLRIKDTIPNFIDHQGKTWVPIGVNPIISLNHYFTGSNTVIHRDKDVDDNKRITKTKLLVYLNSDFEGGETHYYTDDEKLLFTTNPKKGDAILFNCYDKHRGNTVTKGQKYVVGFRIIYRQEP